MLHLQEIVRGPLNVLPDLVAMSGTIKQGPQDEHVQRALEQIRALLCLFCHRRRSTLGDSLMVDIRLSIVKDGALLLAGNEVV